MPLVFKVSAALILAALAGGLIWHGRPASHAQIEVLAQLEQECPGVGPAAGKTITERAYILKRDACWQQKLIRLL